MKGRLPEVFCDLNARMTENGYLLTSGSLADLVALGLSPEQAVGMQFTFNGGDDADEEGHPAEILFEGAIEKDEKWGCLAIMRNGSVYWRRKNVSQP